MTPPDSRPITSHLVPEHPREGEVAYQFSLMLREAPASRESKSSSPPMDHVKEEKDNSNIAEEQVPAAAGASPPHSNFYRNIDKTSK